MARTQGGRDRREWRWPLLGVVSVLLPALVFAALAYRDERSRHERALTAVASAAPEQLARIYLEAQSDDWDDVVAAASLTDREAAGSLRGLKVESIGEAMTARDDSAPAGAPPEVVVRASVRTARVQVTGEAPGPETFFLRLVNKGGRWYVAGGGTAP